MEVRLTSWSFALARLYYLLTAKFWITPSDLPVLEPNLGLPLLHAEGFANFFAALCGGTLVHHEYTLELYELLRGDTRTLSLFPGLIRVGVGVVTSVATGGLLVVGKAAWSTCGGGGSASSGTVTVCRGVCTS
jgi:hypothetical protein